MPGLFWLLLGFVCSFLNIVVIYEFLEIRFHTMTLVHMSFIRAAIYPLLWYTQTLFLCLAYVFGRRPVPKQLMGRYVRSAVDVITLCGAIIVRVFVPYSSIYSSVILWAMPSWTVHLHVLCQLWRAVSDFGFGDVLLGALMQILVYKTSKNLFASIKVVMLCGGVIFYRYQFYSSPVTPIVHENKSEMLSC